MATTATAPGDPRRLGLVAAFERHNFGDWLLAYTADALLGASWDTAWVNVLGRMGVGMSRQCGRFVPVWEVASDERDPIPVLHVGGETLACRLLPAIRMSLAPEADESLDPRELVPISRPLAYVTPAVETVLGHEVSWGPRGFFGVGGREILLLPRGVQQDLAVALRQAPWVSVRDTTSQANLASLGVPAALHPDLVTALPAVLEPNPREQREGLVLLQVSHALAATFGPDLVAALAPLARRFDRLEIGIAGVAPFHDRFSDVLDLVAALDSAGAAGWARPFLEVHPLAIARRIASAELVVASSLHYRVLSMAFGVPGVSFGVPKSIDYAAEWDIAAFGAVEGHGIISQIHAALEPSSDERTARSEELRTTVLDNWQNAIGALTHD